jgi:hypothetical protein
MTYIKLKIQYQYHHTIHGEYYHKIQVKKRQMVKN